MVSTWRHVERRSTSEIRSYWVRRGKSKVRQLDGMAAIGNQDILGLEVPVVDSNGVAVRNGIQDLEKGILDQSIITNIETLLGDAREEITLGAVLQNDIGAILRVHNLNQRDHVGVTAGFVVELDLSLLEASLPRVESELVQGLDRILPSGKDILSGVYYAIRTHSENAGQFKPSGKAEAQTIFWRTCSQQRRWRRGRKHYQGNRASYSCAHEERSKKTARTEISFLLDGPAHRVELSR